MNFTGRCIRVSGHAFGFALTVALGPAMLLAVDSGSQVVVRQLRGESLSHSLIGTDPARKLAVYLPAGYEGTAQR
jgi:hypothetical protein